MNNDIAKIMQPFTGNQIRQWLVMAEQASRSGISLDALYRELVAHHDEAMVGVEGVKKTGTGSRRTRCPSCGDGFLERACSVGGLHRRGCRKCYYSEVV